jgi:hypothetical protein
MSEGLESRQVLIDVMEGLIGEGDPPRESEFEDGERV